MARQIVIKKTYFENIKVAIDAMNKFFSSNFKTKAFPVVNSDFQLDRIVARTISWLNNIEPSWIDDPNKAVAVLDELKKYVAENKPEQDSDGAEGGWSKIMDSGNSALVDQFHAFIGFKVLQFIADNFEKFEELLNGIYSFDLFCSPSKYRESIELFTSSIPMQEISDFELPGEYKLFDAADYVNSIFENDQIKLPEDMVADTEINRFKSYTDLQDVELVVDEAVQEAAEIDYFEDAKPDHIKYDSKSGKWKISKQFEARVDRLLQGIKSCDTTEDLQKCFSDVKASEPEALSQVVMPYIYAKVFTNPKKWDGDLSGVESFENYTKSYESIVSQNGGAKRFQNYDVFSTFKTDKEGTIQFLEDFLKLNLVNNPSAAISNNTLLTLFNIFDSRIYLDILYNMIPEEARDGDSDIPDKDGFVKQIRSRINKNSKSANPYQKEKKVDDTVQTSDQVSESVYQTMKELGDMSIADMSYCEQFAGAVYDEISTLGDALYNKGVSPIMIDRYIGESHDLFYETDVKEPVQEQETGDIPDYMKNRIKVSDEAGDKPPVTVTDVELPPDVPTNDIDDLADSINARMDGDADSLGDMFGAGYKGPVKSNGGQGQVVYNITNNHYHNSNNTTTTTNNTTTNDLSSGKQTTTNISNVNNDLSSNKRTVNPTKRKSTNNYDNTSQSTDTKDSPDTFSNGKTVQEVFALLESEEPLFVEADAGEPPKGDLLTTAMDADRETLSLQQKAKHGVQKVVNTGRAIVKPVARTKQWLTKMIDSLIKRDEDRVKAEIVENPSYRSAIYKAARIALKAGLFSVCWAVTPWLGVAYAGTQGLKLADRQRLQKEVQSEIATEIQIVDSKIEHLKSQAWHGDPSKQKEMYQLMRIRQKLVDMSGDSHRQTVKSRHSVY